MSVAKLRLAAALLTSCSQAACPVATLQPEVAEDGSLRRVSDSTSGWDGYLYVPTHTSGRLPLLVFLHGRGESGKGGDELPKIISEGATGPMLDLSTGAGIDGLRKRFAVAAPQAEAGKFDPNKVIQFTQALLECSDCLPAGSDWDKTRVYVTGHSDGGHAAILAAVSGKFAAVAPVAPSGGSEAVAALSAVQPNGQPLWALHGRNDIVISYLMSENIVNGLRDAGMAEDDARLTIFNEAPPPPGAPQATGHGSTIPAYAMSELFDWIISYDVAQGTWACTNSSLLVSGRAVRAHSVFRKAVD